MKRMMILLLAMLLLALPALGEESAGDKLSNALYRIVLRTEEGDVTLGSGVLFVEKNLLLTAECCYQDGALYAIGRDGEFPIVYGERADDSGMAMVMINGQSAGEPLLLAGYETSVLPYLFGAAQGEFAVKPLYGALDSIYRDLDAMVLRSDEGMLPGAVVIDTNGDIIALVVAQQAEGRGMYISLDADGIVQAINAYVEGDSPAAQAEWKTGGLIVSWEDEERTGGQYAVIISSEENEYFTWFEADSTERSVEIILPPGHTYSWQVQWVKSGQEPEPDWRKMNTAELPAQPLTDYGFWQKCYLAVGLAEDEPVGELPVPKEITAAVITDEKTEMYLQVFNTYDVDGERNFPMTVELIAPDGQFFFESFSYTFAPEYEEADNFALPVQILFDNCAEFSGGTLPLGDYVLRYTIGGKIAGEYAFTLEK